MTKGILYGLGVGPGDGDLITVRGKDILSRTDVLCIPISKRGRESVAYTAASRYLRDDVRIVELLFPMSRDEDVLEEHWIDAARQVSALLADGETVTFVTIGDPFLYSTFGYLLRYLRRENPEAQAEVIPGVSAINAAAAVVGVPLVEKDERLAVVPVPVDEEELKEIAKHFDTIVFLKVSAAYDQTLEMLRRIGLDEEVYLVTRCGSAEESWTNNPFTLRGEDVDYLSLLIAKRRRPL
ncbi:MAG: precorrin-2 C(20)-methyltransferase [Clostridiales bacterium]|nr:precorrin-2 C(20)-methyltransferase [Clostridiales bacterium]